jgi:cell division protein FtsI (penicillin-binding protein 3)
MNYKGRIILASAIIAAVFAGLGVRLAFLHLRPSAETLARIERSRSMTEETRGPRGRILDRSGNILAVDIAARHLCADPKFMLEQKVNLQTVCEAVSKTVPLSRSEVWKLLDQPERQYVRIQRYMREKTLEPLMEMKIKGLIFEETTMRNYPKGALGAHVVGFSNREGVGSAGAELRMNSYLQGTTGLKVSLKDGRRHEIYTRRTVDIEPQRGADVYLTIDQQVQYFTEQALDELVQQYHPQGAWAIVQRVDTGEILAMASWPTFNPNRYNDPNLPAEWLRNRAIGYGYEPGSVMKAMIIASALDGGYVTPRDMFDCENGRWYYGGSKLDDSHPEGILSVADILKKSSNIGAAKIALQMGDEKTYQCLKDFGFGARTGMDLPGEEAGILWPVKNWSKISITRLAMGHEINVTALQMLSALSAIANDGVRMRPYLIEKVVDPAGEIIFESLPAELGRPIRTETARLMRRLLARVTQPGGTGTKAAVRGYPVAGKTGTAQKVRPKEEGGGYYDRKFIASFAGFLPVENPAISIIVVADDPQGAYYGGTVCGPAFQRIADQTVRYLRISPQGFPTEYVSDIE